MASTTGHAAGTNHKHTDMDLLPTQDVIDTQQYNMGRTGTSLYVSMYGRFVGHLGILLGNKIDVRMSRTLLK